ncbi:MAG: hypothetical protein ACOYKN_20365, partial [Pirellula sp.]
RRQGKNSAEHYWLEAYPTCLGSVDHAQTDRAHREGRIDDCRVMIVEMEEVGRVVYSVLVFYLTNHHCKTATSSP